MPQKIIFVEDDPDYGLIISSALEENGYLVDYIDNLDRLPELLRAKHYDLLLLDLEVKDRNSIDEIPSIHLHNPRLPIIVASSHTLGKEVCRCYEAGIKQYIKKPYDIDEILHILRICLPDVREIGNFQLYAESHQLCYKIDCAQLAPKEYQLLCILADQSGKVVTREYLFNQIWEGDIQEDSLNNLISSLRHYLKKDNTLKVETVKGIGYRLSI